MEDRLYTTQETAAELGVTDSAVRHWVRLALATPYRRVGRNWLFTAEEIERLRNRSKSKGGRPPKQK